MDSKQLLKKKKDYIEIRSIEIYSNKSIDIEEKAQRIEILKQKVLNWSKEKFDKKSEKYMDRLLNKLAVDFFRVHSDLDINETDIKDDSKMLSVLKIIMTRRNDFGQRLTGIRKDNFHDYAYYINLWLTAYSIENNIQRITNSLKILDNMILRSLMPVYLKLAKKNNWFINEKLLEENLRNKAFRLKVTYFYQQLLKGEKVSPIDKNQKNNDYEQLRTNLELINSYFSKFRNPVEHGAYRKDNELLETLKSDNNAVESLENLVFDLLRQDSTKLSSEYNFDIKALEEILLYKKYARNSNRHSKYNSNRQIN